MKHIFTLVILVSFLNPLKAQEYYSINDGFGDGGNWTNGSYWSNSSGGSPLGSTPGSSPGSGKSIFIETYIEMDASITDFGYLKIYAGDSLKTTNQNLGIKSGATLVVQGVLKVYDLTFFNGSIIDVKTGGVIIVLHNFTNKNNSDDVNIDGSVTVNGTFDNGNGGVISGNGSITASNFTGSGTTFGYENGTIPPGTTVSTGSLPVELISFTGKLNNSKVNLKWQTASEINNDYFSVERSNDGVNFETIARIDGKGNYNGLSEYQFTDNNPLNNTSYYRLKQTDFDGKFEYSDIISITYSLNTPAINSNITLYPNPAQNGSDVKLEMTGMPADKEVLVVVTNVLGQQMYSKVILTDNNGNMLYAVDPYNQLPPGTYIIVATANDKLLSKRLIIQ